DLLREVHEWTGFADQFTHVRTGDAPQNIAAMLAGVLADGTNLAYRAAQACVTDAHTRHPHSQIWGDGTKASSDGQFFRASDRAA
ncbi:Tn3 family transposase, partial [Rhizobium leguminosarum]|uniref:Tn3 family transposase n=1 Tax=Rhizobium leguminosarum TaxID=384 RepID=UPI0013B5BD2B